MEGGGWSSFAAPLPNAHPRLAGPLLLRPLQATIWSAWQQLQTYKSDLPTLFSKNEALVVSDGNGARVGTLTSGREWFKPWRTVTGETMADPHMTEPPGDAGGRLRAAADSRAHPRLHSVRGRRQRRARQEDGGVSPFKLPCTFRRSCAGRNSEGRARGATSPLTTSAGLTTFTKPLSSWPQYSVARCTLLVYCRSKTPKPPDCHSIESPSTEFCV